LFDSRNSLVNSTWNRVLKRFHYPWPVILTSVRWYVAIPLRPQLA